MMNFKKDIPNKAVVKNHVKVTKAGPMLPCHPFVPSEFAALEYSTDFVTCFFLGERTIIAKEDSIQAQLDGPINFSGLLTGIQMIDSCN